MIDTKRKLRVLVVEDSEVWQELLLETLHTGGFVAHAVSNIPEARLALEKSLHHLLVLDIQLSTHKKNDTSGMAFLEELARSGDNSAIKVVMLSAYGTMDQSISSFRDYDVLDFANKSEFDNHTFIARLKEKFLPHLRINLDLKVHWQRLSGPEEAVLGTRVRGERLGRSNKKRDLTERAACELDDLICRLFHEANEVILKPLLGGQGGGGVLHSQASYEGRGAAQPRVVKFGETAAIRSEAENYRHFVADFVGGGRSTHLETERHTPLLGGLTYSLVGVGEQAFQTWLEFYPQASREQVRHALENLFIHTCGNWYANSGSSQAVNLTEEYQSQLGFTQNSLLIAFERGLPSVQGGKRVQFQSLEGDRRFANPLELFETPPLTRMTYLCTTHGDLNAGNLLVDEHEAIWLIDFQRTGPGHILRDFAQLDATTRFLLLGQDKATLEERLVLEETLSKCEHFGDLDSLADVLETDNPHLARAYETSLDIRRLAARQAALRALNDFSEYHIASMFFALNWIRFYDNPRLLREHAFLSAALLAEKVLA